MAEDWRIVWQLGSAESTLGLLPRVCKSEIDKKIKCFFLSHSNSRRRKTAKMAANFAVIPGGDQIQSVSQKVCKSFAGGFQLECLKRAGTADKIFDTDSLKPKSNEQSSRRQGSEKIVLTSLAAAALTVSQNISTLYPTTKTSGKRRKNFRRGSAMPRVRLSPKKQPGWRKFAKNCSENLPLTSLLYCSRLNHEWHE